LGREGGGGGRGGRGNSGGLGRRLGDKGVPACAEGGWSSARIKKSGSGSGGWSNSRVQGLGGAAAPVGRPTLLPPPGLLGVIWVPSVTGLPLDGEGKLDFS
jgi:hypothetical protein